MFGGDARPEPTTIEPVPINEEFISGLAYFEIVGDVTFLIFYIDHIPPPEFGSGRERRIARKLVMPNDAVDRMRRMLETAVQQHQAPAERTPRSFDH